MMIQHLAPLVLALSLLGGSPIVIRDDRSDADSIELAKRFDATVMFVGDGCGTLIGERWVLTAAHVARGQSPFSPRVRVGGKEYAVRQSLFHPDSVSDGRRPPRVDLALVELTEPVTGVEPVPLYTGDDEVGREAFVVGYGDFGSAGTRLKRGDGVRRAATNEIDSAERGQLRIDFDAPPEGTRLEGVGGPGDSGGPLYLEVAGELYVAGVSSASMGGRPGTYGVIDIYARVSEAAPWIAKAQADAAQSPVQGPKIHDVTGGFPTGDRGTLVEAFFAGFGDGEKIAQFAERYRSTDARRRNPEGAFEARMTRLASELGELTPTRVAEVSPQHWVALAETTRAGWRAVHFRFAIEEGAVRMMDLGMRNEVAPKD